MTSRITTGLGVVCFAACINASQGAAVQWTDWTRSDLATAHGSTGGVRIQGSFSGGLRFAQLGNSLVGTGAQATATRNFWTEGSPQPYTGNSTISNAPTPREMIGFERASSNRIVFEHAVQDPIMAILSMGQHGVPVTYDFDAPFTVLSEGSGYWGNGSFTLLPGDQLVGQELHGVIRFSGWLSEINWTSTAEHWHGVTFGLAGDSKPVDVQEPGSIALWLLLGLAGFAHVPARVRERLTFSAWPPRRLQASSMSGEC